METLFLIAGIAIAAMMLFRPTRQTQIMYVPVEVTDERDGLGCLPLIIGVILILLALFALG